MIKNNQHKIATQISFTLISLIFLLTTPATGWPGDLQFSDPANTPPVPGYAIGYPSRDANLDVLPGFQNPPRGYGEVAFYWWLGDPLTMERLSWQIDRLAGKGVMGLQVNYAHSDKGGRIYGLTYPSDPPLFSEEWWKLFGNFLQDAKKHDMAVSLSDYTLGVGQGSYIDEIRNNHPELYGATLDHQFKTVEPGKELICDVTESALSIMAYQSKNGSILPDTASDLRQFISNKTLHWQAPPSAEPWHVFVVSYIINPFSVDPMNPKTGEQVIKTFFQRFEDHNPGEGGKGLNFFFSDELEFGVSGNLWTKSFSEEFKKRKGYDLLPLLPALFTDIGPKTPKIRLDYRDVMVSLEEEGYFRPVFEWHNQRGMIYGCDHGGRGENVVEFGDYFRTQRWMNGPGCDQPRLEDNIVKNKVASSIAHLYQRPRTWIEGYHSSGWGTTLEELTDATFKNFVMGQNLLTLHGLYYSTHGGYWEWAPPCNHFRMPYWEHITEYMNAVQRMSYILSQGAHRCDVAILYPVAPMEADMGGKESVQAAFDLGEKLYKQGIDFDYMDFESLARSQVKDKELQVSGESYKVLILPAMKAVRYSTMLKAQEFNRNGGIVIALGALPEASERIGRDDPELDAMNQEIFALTAKETTVVKDLKINKNNSGGLGLWVQNPEQVITQINQTITRDFIPSHDNVSVLHRQAGQRDVYMIYGANKNTECFFEAKGVVELWNLWDGSTKPIYTISQTDKGTKVRMPLETNEAQVIVFTPGEPEIMVDSTNLDEIASIQQDDKQYTITGFAETPGNKSATIRIKNKPVSIQHEISNSIQKITIDGNWQFELKPTMDNRWGDFSWPPTNTIIGAQARKFRYREQSSPNETCEKPDLDDSSWPSVTYSYGQQFWKLGPLPANAGLKSIDMQLAKLQQIDPAKAVEIKGKAYAWSPYSFSWRWGIEGDPGHQGWHGLKEEVHDEFIGLGKFNPSHKDTAYEKEENGTIYYLWTSIPAEKERNAKLLTGEMKPAALWINHSFTKTNPDEIQLKPGSNPVLIRYDQPGKGYTVFIDKEKEKPSEKTTEKQKVKPLKMSWYENSGVLPFDASPQKDNHIGWYRFDSPPGLSSITMIIHGKLQAWADGSAMTLKQIKQLEDGSVKYEAVVSKLKKESVVVALRIEQDKGFYGGAAIPEPINFYCTEGTISLGDWSKIYGLASYSGGVWYRKTFTLPENQAKNRILLDLGKVKGTAELHINGQKAGIRIISPYTFDISPYTKTGENKIEILLYNTLANHYSTIPTRYRGSMESGLFGPVSVKMQEPVLMKTPIIQ